VETDPAETAPHLRVERFWQTFVAATGIDGPYTAWGFGSDATALGLLVRDGPKRATASNYSWYRDDGEPMPEVGHLSVVLDGEGEPLCVIRTTDVEVRRFGDVDEEFAWTEGEGDRSLAHWRTAHIEFFAGEGRPIDEDSEVVLERFELLWPRPSPPATASKIQDPRAGEPRRSPRTALLPIAVVLGISIVARKLIGH
jgi:uncharacterized protein YhfF